VFLDLSFNKNIAGDGVKPIREKYVTTINIWIIYIAINQSLSQTVSRIDIFII
jgi:hypothetical protein